MTHNRNIITALGLLVTLALTLGACSENKFKVKGHVEGADDTPLTVEKADAAGGWMAVDSTRTNSKGDFSLSIASPGAPEIYRLVCDGEYIYFPVDSTESLSVTTTKRDFATASRVRGSKDAEALSRFDSTLNALPATPSSEQMAKFKRDVFATYIAPAQGSVTSYYILTKTRGGHPLYDPADAMDAKYFAAVATAFEQYRPDDPRTPMLRDISLKAMRRAAEAKGNRKVVEAPEVAAFEIALPDTEGNTRRLSEVLGHGRPVVLVFTVLSAPTAPAYNAELKKIHDSGRADIFMIGLDMDRLDWRQAARNLPWINVYEPDGDRAKSLRDYNVSVVPVSFIFNSKGELVDRVGDPTTIAAKIK